MKLLFDQNLSPRLVRLLADIYPDSIHVRELGMRESADSEIWEYAKVNVFVIVSKDSDFQQRSLYWVRRQSSFGFVLATALCKEPRICYEPIRRQFTHSVSILLNRI